MTRGLLLYDADCGFCTRASGWVPRLGLDVRIAPMQSVDLGDLGVDEERAVCEMPYLDDAGAVHYGHVAWASALRTGGWACRIVGRLLTARGVNALSARAYRWVSTHRHLLPGGTATCAVTPPPDNAHR